MELNKEDLLWCVQRLPKRVKDTMKQSRGYIPVVAGGFIRSCIANEKISDIDMFAIGGDDKSPEEFALSLARIRGVGIVDAPKKSPNTWQINVGDMPVQMIHRWRFDTVEDCILSLDFTICQAAIWWNGSEWVSACVASYYQDLAAKRLNYTAPERDEDAGGSMLRILKYYQRGYRIPLDSLGLVIARMVSGIKEENFRRIGSMPKESWEKQIGHVLTGLLRIVDPLTDPDHISNLPARITE